MHTKDDITLLHNHVHLVNVLLLYTVHMMCLVTKLCHFHNRRIFEESEQCLPGNAIRDIFMLDSGRTWPPAVLKSPIINAEQCRGSASVPRQFTLIHEPGSNGARCSMDPDVTEHGDSPVTDCSDEDFRM